MPLSSETKDMPEDFQPDCSNCAWFMERYEREDLYLFVSLFDGQYHALNRYGAKEKADG